MSKVDNLDQLAKLIDEMILAAERRDGELLTQLGQRYESLSGAILGSPITAANDPDARRIVALSELVLARQTALHCALGPWEHDMKIVLRENRQEHALAAAYRPLE